MSAETCTAGRAVAAISGCRDRFAPYLLLLPAVLVLLVFFLGPLLFNLIESLKVDGVFAGGQYSRLLGDTYYLSVLAHTIILGALTTIICLVLGYPFAIALTRARGGWRAALIFIVVAPLLINMVVRSFGWMVVLGGNGLISSILSWFGVSGFNLMYSWTAVGIALVHVLLPFMVLSIASVLETLDESLEEAAAVMGASPTRVFTHVTFPLSIEGVITGSILVFTLTLGSFVTVLLLGSTSTMVLPLLIYQQLTVVSDWPFGAAMGVVLLTIVLFLLWLQSRLRRRPGVRS